MMHCAGEGLHSVLRAGGTRFFLLLLPLPRVRHQVQSTPEPENNVLLKQKIGENIEKVI